MNDGPPAKKTGRGFLIFVCLFSSIGGVLFGYDIGIVSGVKTNADFLDTFGINYSIKANYPEVSGSNTWLVEAFVSSLLLGCAIGSLSASYVADRWGRKWVVFWGAVLFSLTTVWVAVSSGFWSSLIPARVCCGISVGALSFCVPLYIGEIAPPSIRGTLVALQQLAIVLGILLAFLANLGLLNLSNPVDHGWRYSISIAAAFGAILAAGAPILPESPRWLLQHKGREAALSALLRVRSELDAVLELEAMEESFDASQRSLANAPSFGRVVLEVISFAKTASRRIRIAMAIQLFQQLTGINVVLYFAPEIFSQVSPTLDPLVPTAILGATNLAFTVVSLWLVERVGRRRLFLTGNAIMGVSICVVGVLAAAASSSKLAGDFSIALLLLFVAGFAVSWGPLGWIYPAEILPQAVRAKGVALSTATNWVCNFAIGLGSLSLYKAIGASFWFILVGLQLAAAIFVFVYVLETKGKTLEKINEMFAELEEPRNAEAFDSKFPMGGRGMKKAYTFGSLDASVFAGTMVDGGGRQGSRGGAPEDSVIYV